jgi:hypothetical protein
MSICGVEIKASEAVFALAALQGTAISHLPLATRKLALADDDEAVNVKAFAVSVQALVDEHGITRLAIKKRGKKGEFAGGATTFKIEAVLQLLDRCEVILVSPQTLTATMRKHEPVLPASLNKYQWDAYKSAFALLIKGTAVGA